MFKTLILFCSLDTPGADCDKTNALLTIPGQRVQGDMACMKQAQIEMAQHVGELPANSYPKVLCVREHEREAQK